MVDLILAIAHHLLVFSLAGVIAAELAMVRTGLTGAGLRRLGTVDLAYGAIAGAIVAVGFARVFFGAKGPTAYLPNPFFWAKLGVFALVGLLSVPPTVRFIGWRRKAAADPAFSPSATEVGAARQFILAEACLFPFIPAFAAVMARGYGLG
jgi:putative membrane protein